MTTATAADWPIASARRFLGDVRLALGEHP